MSHNYSYRLNIEAIRKEAFEEAAETLLAYVGDMEGSSVRMIAAEIRTLGEPKSEPEPDPRTRRITVQLKEGTYSFDRDREHPVQRFRITGTVLMEDADLLLYALEMERKLLGTERHAPPSARLEHLNLFLGERA